MNHDLLVFLQGIASTAAWVNGLFFLKFWRESGEALFGFFGAAFGLMNSTPFLSVEVDRMRSAALLRAAALAALTSGTTTPS